MNCREFNDRLHEYLDEALDVRLQPAAREHLRQCADCRAILVREQAVAQSIRHSLEGAAAGLSLRPDIRRKVLQALESETSASNTWMNPWRRLVSAAIRPVSLGGALVGVLLVLIVLQSQQRMPEHSSPNTTEQIGRDFRVIDVPMQTQTHVFQQQDDSVVDSINPRGSLAHARLF